MTREKRRYPRLLCNDNFSNSQIDIGEKIYEFVSVNFNRSGIAVYSHLRLPDTHSCRISFSLNCDDLIIDIEGIPAEIKYRYEEETGNQYGIEFKVDDPTIEKQLQQIEDYLASHTSLEDRWPGV